MPRLNLVLGGIVALAVVAVLAVIGFGALSGASGGSAGETIVQGRGGQWTDVTPDRLADMLSHKDFTFVNVKTPYVGEIRGTDLYIPYDQLAARSAELPQDRAARILVYCRSGNESRMAAQTLLDLGYGRVYDLAGGMVAWTASGRTTIDLGRQ